MNRAGVGGLLAVLLPLAACGSEVAPETASPSAAAGSPSSVLPTEDQESIALPEPRHVTVAHGATVLDLQSWTTCWTGDGESYCADGMPPADPSVLGEITGEVEITFPHDGWSWSAVLQHPTEQCTPMISVDIEPAGDHRWVLQDAGPIGTYLVGVSGNGPEGSVSVSFEMTSTREGSVPGPSSAFDLFFADDDEIVMYGPLTLTLSSLRPDAEVDGGELVVVAADGTRTQVALNQPPAEVDGGCRVPGHHWLTDGTGDPLVQFEQLDGVEEYGPAPYEITLTVAIDGEEHIAQVSFPADVDEATSSMLPEFSPPLPPATTEDYATFYD